MEDIARKEPKMDDDGSLVVLRQAVADAAEDCTDAELLDLVYRLLRAA